MTVRTRFAPSPTGSLHVGGARTALYCWLHARKHDGVFLLRIEDTDRARSSEEATAGILRDMRWLGIDWDEGPGTPDPGTGPFLQSQRLDVYGPYFDQLLLAGHAYEAFDTREELAADRAAAEAAKVNFRYRRKPLTDAQISAYRAEGRDSVLRLAAPDHAVHVHDLILGPVTKQADELDDLVIRKADGFPTYHFAVVVDDHLMGVTLVLRGQEHLQNTHKHLGLYDKLGWHAPDHAHLPVIFNPGGGKMSKRDKARAARAAARAFAAQEGHGKGEWAWLADATGHELEEVRRFMKKKHDGLAVAEAIAVATGTELPMIEVMDFRKAGYLPEALINYLALLGWSPGDDREFLTPDEMIAAFDITRVNKTSARFDPDKVRWMNGEYVKRTSLDRLLDAHDAYLEVVPDSPLAQAPRDLRSRFLALYQPRMDTFAHLDEQAAFFFAAPDTWDAKAVKKHLAKGGGWDRLEDVAKLLGSFGSWTATDLEACMEGFAEAQGVRMGKVAQPVRVAITGAGVSPPIGETLELLGRDATLARIHACLATRPPEA